MQGRVLLVDDDPALLDLISQLFKSFGLEVKTAVTVGEALDSMGFNTFDLVVSDYNIGKYSGLKFLGMLRSNPKTQKIPFLLISGTATQSQIDEILAKGATDFLRKPFNKDTLLDKVRRILIPPGPSLTQA